MRHCTTAKVYSLLATLGLAAGSLVGTLAARAGDSYYDSSRHLVAISFASACQGKDLFPKWKCSWCKTMGDQNASYRGFKSTAYVVDKANNGAAVVGHNAATNEIFVSYRSTVLWSMKSIVLDFRFSKVNFKSSDGKVRGQVHKGFHDGYRALDKNGVGAAVANLLKEHPKAKVVLVGHSLGGALVTMAAADLAPRYPARSFTVHAYGAPRLGGQTFADWFAGLKNVTYHRVVTADDPVPHAPKLLQKFVHVGSAQEYWYKKKENNKSESCPKGENKQCANTVVMPANFVGAHALYLGLKFDQCSLPYDKLKESIAVVGAELKKARDAVVNGGKALLEKGKETTKKVVTKGKETTKKVVTKGKETTKKVITKGKETLKKLNPFD